MATKRTTTKILNLNMGVWVGGVGGQIGCQLVSSKEIYPRIYLFLPFPASTRSPVLGFLRLRSIALFAGLSKWEFEFPPSSIIQGSTGGRRQVIGLSIRRPSVRCLLSCILRLLVIDVVRGNGVVFRVI